MPTPNTELLADAETVEARINRVTFTNDTSGWSVLSVTIDDQHASAVGYMLNPEAGSIAKLHGSWVQDARHGRQFEFVSYSPELPAPPPRPRPTCPRARSKASARRRRRRSSPTSATTPC